MRGIVSLLRPGENNTADKVDITIKKQSSQPEEKPTDSVHVADKIDVFVKETLPRTAEKTTEVDEVKKSVKSKSRPPVEKKKPTLDAMPDEILLIIFQGLDADSLGSLKLTSHRLLNISSECFYQGSVEQRVGTSIAAQLKKSRLFWRDVKLDLCQPFKSLCNDLYHLGVLDCDGWGNNKSELKEVIESIKKNDIEKLQQALSQMKVTGRSSQINSRYFGVTPLEAAAKFGYVEIARLLIKFGARDALTLREVSYRSKDLVKGMSALYYAALNGNVGMVKFLLENGARPHLNLERNGFNQPFLKSLLGETKNETTDFLECVLLLINAWKTESRYVVVCESEDAIHAFNTAVERGHGKVAHLLFALGIQPKLSGKLIKKGVHKAIAVKSLDMIEFFSCEWID